MIAKVNRSFHQKHKSSHIQRNRNNYFEHYEPVLNLSASYSMLVPNHCLIVAIVCAIGCYDLSAPMRSTPSGNWSAHSNYSSVKPYIDIVDDIKATSMTKFNGLLEVKN